MIKNSLKRFSLKLLIPVGIGLFTFLTLLIYFYSGGVSLVTLVRSEQAIKGELQYMDPKTGNEIVHLPFFCKPNRYQTKKIRFRSCTRLPEELTLRFSTQPGQTLVVDYILIKKSGFHPIDLHLADLGQKTGVAAETLTNELALVAAGDEITLKMAIPKDPFRFDLIELLLCLSVSIVLALVIRFSWAFFCRSGLHNASFPMALGLVLVLGLSLAMAIKAGFNASPDERDHFMAAEYYKTHSLTPVKFSDQAVYTYNALWYYTRVCKKSLSYFLAGKFSDLVPPHVESYHAVRFFGLFLLVLFLFLIVRFPKHRYILLPILLMPQVWYLFCYPNEEALPLFLSFVWLLTAEAGKTHLLAEHLTFRKGLLILFLGSISGLLLLSKEHYQAFSLFYLFYLFVLPVHFDQSFRQNVLRIVKNFRLPLAVVLVALTVAGSRYLTVEKKQDLPLRESTARYYELSKEQYQAYLATGISGKARFGSYLRMMKTWCPVSTISTHGVYGYMKYKPAPVYFRLVFAIIALLVLALLVVVIIKRNKELWFWIVVSALSVVAIIFASSYIYSFHYDYQAQGRYLFPVLPILGFTLYKIDQNVRLYYLKPFFVALFFLGLYSFVFIGLVSI